MSFDVARNAYQEIEINAASNLQLVVMLYDGAIRFLNDAKASIRKNDLPGKTLALDRALAIIGELQSTLKMEEGGEIAMSIDKLYAYMTNGILDASLRLDVAPLDEVIKLLGILNSAWTEIANGGPVATQKPETPARLVTDPASRAFELFG